MLQALSLAGLSQSEHDVPAVYVPDPRSLALRGRAPALHSLCSTLNQQLHCGQTKVTRPCYSKTLTALTATRKLLEQPVPSIIQEIRETEADRFIKKTKTEDKWTWAGSSFELNLWVPEIQQNTKLLYVNQGARQSLQPSLLHPGFASRTIRSHPRLRDSRSGVQVPDCNYQADLKAGKGGLLKATFDFSFLTHLLRQAPRQSHGAGTLPRRGTSATCPHRAGRRKNKARSFRILLQKRFSQHGSHVRPQTPVCQHCGSPSIPGSKPASGSAWVQVGPDAPTKMCLSPILTMSTSAAVSPPAVTGFYFPCQHGGK